MCQVLLSSSNEHLWTTYEAGNIATPVYRWENGDVKRLNTLLMVTEVYEQDLNPICLILDASGLPSTLPLWMK